MSKKNKLKTKKSLLRRVKITASGKILHAVTGKRHLRRHKSKTQLRRQKLLKPFTGSIASKIKERIGTV